MLAGDLSLGPTWPQRRISRSVWVCALQKHKVKNSKCTTCYQERMRVSRPRDLMFFDPISNLWVWISRWSSTESSSFTFPLHLVRLLVRLLRSAFPTPTDMKKMHSYNYIFRWTLHVILLISPTIARNVSPTLCMGTDGQISLSTHTSPSLVYHCRRCREEAEQVTTCRLVRASQPISSLTLAFFQTAMASYISTVLELSSMISSTYSTDLISFPCRVNSLYEFF